MNLRAFNTRSQAIARLFVRSIWLLSFPGWLFAADVTIPWHEDFESSRVEDDWAADQGVWEFGVPTSGPKKAFSGTKVAATVLGGNYAEGLESRLVRQSAFLVPDISENPRLRFRHWYSFGAGDYGQVQVKVAGSTQWEPLTNGTYSSHSSGLWAYPSLDLAKYAGKKVQIGFFFHSQLTGNFGDQTSVGPGWYLDDVEVATGGCIFNNPEGFESPDVLNCWVVDNGIWEVGAPTSGPQKAFSGTNVAATILNGNYAENLESRLISPALNIPATDQNPRLRLRHWYSFGAGDYGQVQVKEAGSTQWEPLTNGTYSSHSSGLWAYPSLDLAKYAGKKVQIGFFFHSQLTGNFGDQTSVGPGWYLDDVEVATGGCIFSNPEGFESPDVLNCWVVDNGIWEVGAPTSGPQKAFSGTNVAATILNGNYAENLESRLISPALDIPATDQNPRLRLRHWYSFGAGDYGQVQVKEAGSTQWEPLTNGTYSSHSSGLWAYPSLDLAKYAGKKVQIGFFFHSQLTGNFGDQTSAGPGWYLDDVEVATGGCILNNPEGFESSDLLNCWVVDNGIWEVGAPTSGPQKAFSGTNVAATILNGNYAENLESRLISPALDIPATDQNPRLRLRHWYSFGAGDYGQVQVKEAGSTQWEPLTNGTYSSHSSGLWAYPSLDLAKYAGKKVEIGFFFHSQLTGNFGDQTSVGPGWYLDDVEVATGGCIFSNPEGFESPDVLNCWVVDNGIWEVGAPTSGPQKAFSGTNVAATILNGNYAENLESRLISPALDIPATDQNPRLRFRHWYSFGAGDYGQVQVKEAGSTQWEPLANGTYSSSSSGLWAYPSLDLAEYAGKKVQIGFFFHSQLTGNFGDQTSVGPGWYLDDVKVLSDVLDGIGDKIAVEETLLTFRAHANIPAPVFSLAPGAPEGAEIDPTFGVFTWFPTEDQGPGSYEVTIKVAASSSPFTAVGFETIVISVLETNSPPVLDPIPFKVLKAAVPLQFTATASDKDRPNVQTLTYSLEEGAPAGATINATTGMFSWTPTASQATNTYSITVRVTDSGYSPTEAPPDGSPPLSSTLTFVAGPAVDVLTPTLSLNRSSTGNLQLVIDGGPAGVDYTIQATSELKSPPDAIVWTTLKTVRPDQQPITFDDPDAATLQMRFYRAVRTP